MSNDQLYARLDAEEAKHKSAIEALQGEIAAHNAKLRDIDGARRALASIFAPQAADPVPAAAAAVEVSESESADDASAPVADTIAVSAEPAAATDPTELQGDADTAAIADSATDASHEAQKPVRKRAAKKKPQKKSPAKKAVPAQRTGQRREQITSVLQESGEPMSAAQVAEALGVLEPTRGQVDGVRGVLNSLAEAGLASRQGRGKYAWAEGK
ncbi:hypothetical protein [Streptomyces albipurpureus]|uniref:Regulatory protein n=1 Tax=Streptomyces albipurpureus TaxID=2897419 RepID=A0ABT0UTI3_9ACTN|nr:hypothetical protein [Streptomyces sp. CWNU-1]MCM2391902.1 hypothetical protein [Streptomyces sp. CWNU-1]